MNHLRGAQVAHRGACYRATETLCRLIRSLYLVKKILNGETVLVEVKILGFRYALVIVAAHVAECQLREEVLVAVLPVIGLHQMSADV